MGKHFPALQALNLPNAVTLCSPVAGVLSVMLAASGHTRAALVVYPLTLLFDALDGKLARLLNQCTEEGVQLDSLSDMVSFGAVPPLLLFWLSGMRYWILIGAIPYLFAGGLRLAYFNLHGLTNGCYSGLTITFSALLSYLTMALCLCYAPAALPAAGAAVMLALAVLMVCGLRIPKARGAYLFGAVFILFVYGSVCFRL